MVIHFSYTFLALYVVFHVVLPRPICLFALKFVKLLKTRTSDTDSMRSCRRSLRGNSRMCCIFKYGTFTLPSGTLAVWKRNKW